MPTFLLLLTVLVGRFLFALTRGMVYLVLLPVRTATAVAPYTVHARWLLIGGAVASFALASGAAILLLRGVR